VSDFQRQCLKLLALGAGGGILPSRTAKALERLGLVTVTQQSYGTPVRVYVYWYCALTPAGRAEASK
jgi:hypothetical protein